MRAGVSDAWGGFSMLLRDIASRSRLSIRIWFVRNFDQPSLQYSKSARGYDAANYSTGRISSNYPDIGRKNGLQVASRMAGKVWDAGSAPGEQLIVYSGEMGGRYGQRRSQVTNLPRLDMPCVPSYHEPLLRSNLLRSSSACVACSVVERRLAWEPIQRLSILIRLQESPEVSSP